ncbi:hypothetical protein IJ765_00985 [Candidatus Saccharibacteria bacterium]|nr:hypothetical protein [Candidatus Saccharibacteria bacterium]
MSIQTKKGFTIAELSISIGYVAFLLIAVATLIVYSISIYQKGLTLRSVNNAGLELIDELTRTISDSSNSYPDCNALANTTDRSRCRSNWGNLVYGQVNTTVYIPASNETITAPAYGFFCTGSYSYVWNSGYVLNTDGTYYHSSTREGFTDYKQSIISASGTTVQDYRLLRFNDSNREICSNAWNGSPGSYPASYATASISPDRSITVPNEVFNTKRELMSASSETQLAVYDFHVHAINYQDLTAHALYAGSFTLGTISGSVNIQTSSNTCKDAPDNLNTGFAYCAINKFNFAVRASGKS